MGVIAPPDNPNCTTPPDAEPTRYGDEWQRLVTLTQPFEMMKKETTQNDFYLIMNYKPSQYANCGASCPVENLSWHEAQAYANALSVKRKLPACFDCAGTGDAMRCTLKSRYTQPQDCPGYRLPTEAEWEYAARAGTRTAFYFGELNADNRCSPVNTTLSANGWFCGNSAISYAGGYACDGWVSGFTTCGPQPVAQKPASPWGLYDMHGGIWEWTSDLYAPYSTLAAIDPSGPAVTSADIHAFRGGSWFDYAMYARAAIRRLGYNGDTKRGYIGFRLVRSLPQTCGDPSRCSSHGICDPSSEVGACLCDEGFAGAACDHCADGALGTYPDCFLAPANYCQANSCSAVPPSMQGLCYDDTQALASCPAGCNNIPPTDFCGQDAQSADSHRYLLCIDKDGYEVNCALQTTPQTDEVVQDTLTKLSWQRTSVSDKSWSTALTYCQDLVWASHDDWRLPSPAELAGLVNLDYSAPAIDALAFPQTVTASGYWTNRELASAPTTRAWLVEFADGKTYNDVNTALGAVRCARGGVSEAGTTSLTRYITSTPMADEPLVKDRVTGLYWQGQIVPGLTWKQALSACQALAYAGHSDWRLPNRQELASLIDASIQNPASAFPEQSAQWFWSSSTRAGTPSNAWRVDFTSGNILFGQKTYPYYARCVRGGP